MLTRTERHQGKPWLNISLRKPDSSSKDVCRCPLSLLPIPLTLGICEETLSTQNSQGFGSRGKKQMSMLRCSEFLKSILFLTLSISVLNKINEFEVWPFFPTSDLPTWLETELLTTKRMTNTNAVLVLSNCAASQLFKAQESGTLQACVRYRAISIWQTTLPLTANKVPWYTALLSACLTPPSL